MAFAVVLLAILQLGNVFAWDDDWYMTDLVKEMFVDQLSTDHCHAAWPKTENCVSWRVDEEKEIRYVMTNSIPLYHVDPYCPFGVGKGYCLPGGSTHCPMFRGIVCPGQRGAPSTGDVPVAVSQLYGFPMKPDPTNASRPLNLYELNPLSWQFDARTGLEMVMNHTQDTERMQVVRFPELDLFHVKSREFEYPTGSAIVGGDDPAPNVAFQTIGVHISGIQIKGPAEAEGYNVDAVNIPLHCGGHVTPPVGPGPQYHYHKAAFCLNDSNLTREDDTPSSHSDIIGYANDGFAIYGLHDHDGAAAVVDECNGHFGCLDDACTEVAYHYHMNNNTYSGKGQFTPYYTGCLGPAKGKCNSTVHHRFDKGANWCGPGCGYEICVQPGTNENTLKSYIGSFGNDKWLDQFTINPYKQ